MSYELFYFAYKVVCESKTLRMLFDLGVEVGVAYFPTSSLCYTNTYKLDIYNG